MEQSNKIEKNLTSVRRRGRTMYRCPFCEKESDRKSHIMTHIRSVHLQLKKFCDNCKRNISFDAFKRHLRICIGRQTNLATISNRITRSSARSNMKDPQQQVDKSPSESTVNVQNVTHVAPQTHEISETLPKLSGQIEQTTNAAVNEIAHLWTYERLLEDEFDIFGKFVAMELRVLSRNDQFSLKKRIQQLLLEYEAADKIIEAIEDHQNISATSDVIQSRNQSIKENDMSSNQGFSHEVAASINGGGDESESLLTPKREPIGRDNVLKPLRCSFCHRESDFFHDNLYEIKAKYSQKQILDTFDGVRNFEVPKTIEDCVCCDECLQKINIYDLERVTLDKTMQADFLTIDHD